MPPSLGEAVLHLVGDDSKLTANTTAAKTKVEGILGKIGTGMKMVGTGILATGTAITALGVGIYAMTAKGAANADAVMEMSAQYGVATDQIQKMKYASELVDVPLETMLGSFTRLTMSMGAAKDPTSEQAELFKRLGVDAIDPLTGQLRSANDVWLDTVGALGGIENSAERDAVSLKLFGRSAMELNPLIVAGTDALKELGDQAQASGYVMTESQLKALGGVDDAIQKMKRGAEGVLNQLAGIFAPGIAAVVDTVGGYLGKLGAIMGDESLSISEKIGAASDLVKTIATDIATNLPAMAETGIGILKSIIQGIVAAIPTLMPAIVQVLMSLVQFIVDMLPLILDGALKIIIALAQGLAQALPALVPAIVQTVVTIVQALIDNAPMMLEAALQIIVGLVNGLVMSIPTLIEAVPQLIESIVTALIVNLPTIILAAIQIVIALIAGLIQAIPRIVGNIPLIIMAIVNGLMSGVNQLVEVGKNLMSGFWNGIKSMFTAIWDGIGNFVTGVVDKVKNFLGIHSDSTVMIKMAHHFGGGWITGLSQMQNSVASAMAGFNGLIDGSLSSLGTGMEDRLNAVGALSGRGSVQFASGSANSMGATSKTVNVTVNNPIGETAERSIKNQMQKLSYLGVID